MAKPEVHGAGDTRTGENPHVTSKFDRMHGQPRTPGKVEGPGGTAEPTFAHERHAPSEVHHHSHGTQHSYHPDHPAMGNLHHGARAKHPSHDAKQGAYEKDVGINGGHWPLQKR